VGLESRARGSESRFAAYVEAITSALGHADRAAPFRSYCAGLELWPKLGDGEVRKAAYRGGWKPA
jgi:SRSO17 transposase